MTPARYDAVLLVRNTFAHDARVLRAGRCLTASGHRTLVVAIAAPGLPAREARDGLDVLRLRSPRRPRLRRSDVAAPAAAATQPSRSGSAATRLGPVGRLRRLAAAAAFYAQAVAIIGRHRPRILHCNDHNTMWVGVAARALRGTRVVYDAHELWADRNGRWERRGWLMAAEWLFVRAAHQVVTASPGYGAVIASRYRVVPPTLVRNIPDVPSPPYRAADPASLVYAGGLLAHRGLDQALRGVAHAPQTQLTLIGPGSEQMHADLRARARALGVEDRVRIAEPVPPDELVAELTGHAIGLALIEPSCLSYELTLPNKLFEYLAAGLPVIVTDIPVLAGFVRENGVGEVVPAGDGRALAAAVARMLEPAALPRLRKAVASARETYTWERERSALAGVYERGEARRG